VTHSADMEKSDICRCRSESNTNADYCPSLVAWPVMRRLHDVIAPAAGRQRLSIKVNCALETDDVKARIHRVVTYRCRWKAPRCTCLVLT